MAKRNIKTPASLDTLKKLPGKWVALSADGRHVVGSGSHPRIALKRAYGAGEKNPIVTKVPKDPGTYILSSFR